MSLTVKIHIHNYQRPVLRFRDEFKESDHPRADNGKFGSGSGGASSVKQMTSKQAHLQATPKEQWPAHIKALKIPPAWTDVKVSHDPHANLLASGRDAKGRPQAVYSKRFQESQSAVKFARIKELDNQYGKISSDNEAQRKSGDPKIRDHADCAHLIMQMGVRPGGEEDTGAKVKAYGATTLKGEHVVVEGDKTYLRFTGKKGVALNLPVENADTARMLRDRAAVSGPDADLFPTANASSMLNYVHSLGSGDFKTKDFRTLLATRTAMQQVSSIPAPKDEKSYQKAVKQVAQVVSKKLGNTPIVALQSYISPTVFSQWRASIGQAA